MMNDDQTYQLIENYLNGQLSGEELISFEKELSQNPELNRKYKAHKLANELVIEYRLKGVQSILREEKLNYGKRTLWKKIISVLSGGLILSALLFFIIDQNKSEQKPLSSQTPGKEQVKVKAQPEGKELKTKPIPSRNFPMTDNSPSVEKSRIISYDSLIPNKDTKIPEPDIVTNSPILPKQGLTSPELNNETSKPCDQIDITTKISVNPSCEGEKTGSILLSGFQGGTGPYSYEILMKHQQFENSNLATGTYSAIIKDSKGCTKKIEGIEIVEKQCQKDYSFNPFLGEQWEIPSYKNSGTLILYDKGGNVYFTEEIHAGEKIQWAGQSKNGEIKTGYFLFVIHYSDGTSRQGSVTIVN